MRRASWVVLVALLWACGGSPPPPPRGVIEGDVGAWRFRRYQEVLDVEVWVAGNRGVAYAATYAHDTAEKINRLTDDDIATAMVTRYDKPEGVLRETVKFVRRLAQEKGYQVEEKKLGGVRVVVITRDDEAWALWAAPGHVIKIGGYGRIDVPSSLVESYGDRYPSQLSGDVLEGPLPPGEDAKPDAEDEPEEYDADHPRPDWDQDEGEAPKMPKK